MDNNLFKMIFLPILKIIDFQDLGHKTTWNVESNVPCLSRRWTSFGPTITDKIEKETLAFFWLIYV